MNLYLVGEPESEPNLDWFVVARDPQEAVDTWRKHEMVADFLDGSSKPTVWRIPSSPHHFLGTPRVLEWDDDVKDVTP